MKLMLLPHADELRETESWKRMFNDAAVDTVSLVLSQFYRTIEMDRLDGREWTIKINKARYVLTDADINSLHAVFFTKGYTFDFEINGDVQRITISW